MTVDHFTPVVTPAPGYLVARCPEHGRIGLMQTRSAWGFNACVTEARAHDDGMHDVYRTDSGYRYELASYGQRQNA